jgi:hypothetical protein
MSQIGRFVCLSPNVFMVLLSPSRQMLDSTASLPNYEAPDSIAVGVDGKYAQPYAEKRGLASRLIYREL